jgi:hypothetical protein
MGTNVTVGIRNSKPKPQNPKPEGNSPADYADKRGSDVSESVIIGRATRGKPTVGPNAEICRSEN